MKLRGSFAIEGEAPTQDKAAKFAALLRCAHQLRPLTEDLLVEFQVAAGDHCLAQSGRLPPQFLLPISVAMKKHEAEYLQALTAFSRPARQLCNVTWAGDEHYVYDWLPEADSWFRAMDLTKSVTFTLVMAQASLDTHMRRELEFLALFDRVKRHIDQRHDLRGSDLATLIVTIFQNGGALSPNRRQRYAGRVQPEVLDAIERAGGLAMQGQPLDDDAED